MLSPQLMSGEMMTTYNAGILNERTGDVRSVYTGSNVSDAATKLVLLLTSDGWAGDPDSARRELSAGKSITHKRFTYRVTHWD